MRGNIGDVAIAIASWPVRLVIFSPDLFYLDSPLTDEICGERSLMAFFFHIQQDRLEEPADL
ncbi:hypothetical protein L479_01023 [Exiguobacterium sp. S17]|jgi:hypothetical protein|nr:hypothetical protein L479_01023 [Exiguobacterium sp. S17]